MLVHLKANDWREHQWLLFSFSFFLFISPLSTSSQIDCLNKKSYKTTFNTPVYCDNLVNGNFANKRTSLSLVVLIFWVMFIFGVIIIFGMSAFLRWSESVLIFISFLFLRLSCFQAIAYLVVTFSLTYSHTNSSFTFSNQGLVRNDFICRGKGEGHPKDSIR